jgi:hypothetical protein
MNLIIEEYRTAGTEVGYVLVLALLQAPGIVVMNGRVREHGW